MVDRIRLLKLLEELGPKALKRSPYTEYVSAQHVEDLPLPEVIDLFKKYGVAVDVDTLRMQDIADLLPLLEERTREKNPKRWDSLLESMQKRGFDSKDPAHVYVDKFGKMRLGEGNHRTTIAKLLGIDKIPIRMHYPSYVDEGDIAGEEIQQAVLKFLKGR
jgi:hypothetical protein